MSETGDLLRSGDLPGLRRLLADRVRSNPGQAATRLALADAMIVQDELEKADAQLEIAADIDPASTVSIALVRQLVRAALARRETWVERRPPELVVDPDARVAAALARLAGASGRDEPADELAGIVDDRAFVGLRDGDDRIAGILEVLTTTGKSMWVSFADVASLRIMPAERLRDLVWRRAELDMRGGPSGVVYLPATYPARDATDAQRLGRETDWIEEGDIVRGVGLRTFLVGDEALALGEFETLRVER